ncbi:hypothetical protein D9611_013157 [Ephemerocybe angulata]|uniref:Uncharacterized protein n=1 Tax=Ephemerocybe angulata TaxID=980116 RepID=A0A8H5F9Z2_9AGAR|nr:hypothetical protein D9611_013157 [Tulosesus angulatus]
MTTRSNGNGGVGEGEEGGGGEREEVAATKITERQQALDIGDNSALQPSLASQPLAYNLVGHVRVVVPRHPAFLVALRLMTRTIPSATASTEMARIQRRAVAQREEAPRRGPHGHPGLTTIASTHSRQLSRKHSPNKPGYGAAAGVNGAPDCKKLPTATPRPPTRNQNTDRNALDHPSHTQT